MWQGIVGQDAVVEQFRRRLASGRVNGTFLFVGPSGVGKRTFAEKLAQALLCQAGAHRSLDPCGACEDCRLCEAGNHPDLITVAKPADKSEIPLSLLIGPPENRMRQGLCHEIGLKPFRGGRRIALIDDADELNEEGANALLKTLEEPPPRSVIILLSNGADRQLPTIRSRSQLVRFAPLATDVLAQLMVEQNLANLQDAQRIAPLAEGSLERARLLSEPAVVEFRRELFGLPILEIGQAQALAKLILAFTEAAGKEASARRDRLRLAIGFLAEYFRAVTHAFAGAEPPADPTLQRAADAAVRTPGLDLELLADLTQRTLEAAEHVDRNAHQTMLVEALCDDLARRTLRRTVSA
ncbi:MAG: DNA polymerase III subunit [Pirellulales bacterium]